MLKPNRLFTSKKNTIGGGAIQGEDLGSRIGFAGPKLIKTGKDKGKYVVRYRDEKFGKRKGQKGYNEGNTPPMTKEEAEKFYNERQAKLGELKGSGQKVKILEQTEQINNFVNNFFDKNINKYSVRDYDKFEKNLIKEFKKANIQSLGKGGRNILRHGLPNVGAKDSKLPFDKYNIETFVSQGENPETAYKNYFKKLFFSGKIETDENLRKGINDFLNYEISDKRKSTFNAPENMDEIIYLVADNKTGTGKFRSNIIKKYFPETMDKYIKKKSRSSDLYNQKRALIESKLGPEKLKEILGETSIEKFMRKQSNILKEVFDVSALEPGLHFNLDHAEGIAEIANMENKEDIARALKNLIGMTSARNYELGWRGYSTRRKSLINQIKQGTDVEENLNELNKITGEAYPELKGQQAYNLKNGQLITTKDFDFKYSPEKAFGQYFTELAGTKKGTEQLIKQAAGSPELTKFIKDIEGGDFKNFNKVVSEYQKGKLEFGKELNFYCKVAGQRRLSTGMVPGATCSSADIERGMRMDSKTPEGKARLMKVAKNFGKVFGKIVAPIDIGIESAFALPHLLRGDVEGAIGATTAGLFGAGKEGMEQVGEKFGTDSPEYALYGAENAVQQKMIAIGGLDKLLSQNRQLGIIPEESGEFKKGIGRQPQEEALRKTFTTSFINLAKLDQEATKNFEQYYPLTADITQRNKAIQNVRGLSDEIQSTGFFKNIKGPSDTKTIEGFLETAGGKSQYPLLPTFDIPALRAQATDYTGMDYLDRVSDMPTDVAAQVPEFEKAQIGQGVKEYAMKYGPRAAKEFFEAQGIETQPYLEGMQPGLFMKEGGRINLANGGRLTFAEGPEDPSKRKTLKKIGIGGGIAGGLMTGLINLMDLFKGGKKGVVATKAAESEIEKVYLDLINVVKNKGILKRLDSDLETKVGEVYEYKGVKVLEDGENIELRFETDQGAPAVVEYRKPGYEVDPETGTSQQVPGEFTYEAQEIGRYGPGGDVDLDYVEEIVDPIQNVTNMADEVFETYVYKSPSNRVPTSEVQKKIRDKQLKEGKEFYKTLDEMANDK